MDTGDYDLPVAAPQTVSSPKSLDMSDSSVSAPAALSPSVGRVVPSIDVPLSETPLNTSRDSIATQRYDHDIASQQWYSEIKYYDFDFPGFNMETCQFTQMIWASTERVGFGISGDIVVARYCEIGNIGGEFGDNVGR